MRSNSFKPFKNPTGFYRGLFPTGHRAGSSSDSIESIATEGRAWRRLRRRCRPVTRVALPMLTHASIFSAVFVAAILVRFEGVVSPELRRAIATALPLVVACKLVALAVTGFHRAQSGSVTFVQFVREAEASTLAAAALLLLWPLLRSAGLPLPYSLVPIDWAATVLALAVCRGASRLFKERYAPMLRVDRSARVLVVGATEASVAIIRSLQAQPGLGLRVVGILDSDPAARGEFVAGVPVVGNLEELEAQAARLRVDSVLVASASIPARQAREVARTCTRIGVSTRQLPSLEALVNGRLTAQPRDVDPRELLARDSVVLDGHAIGEMIRGGVVLVTGASGSIGSEICRQVMAFQPGRIILVDHSENGLFYLERELREVTGTETEVVPYLTSITQVGRLRAGFEQFRPDVVIHAAAHKHVPMMELNPSEAVRNNVMGTKNVIDEAVRAGVSAFVLISTDKAVNPSSVMGATKRLAEMYLQSLSRTVSTRLIAVRFGNVIGSTGSVIPVFKEQIRNGGPVTVTHPEMTRYFMTIPEAAQLVLQAASMGRGGEIFVLDMGTPVKIADLARDLIRLSGLREGLDMEIVYSGIRPGEKIHEILCETGEKSLPTLHPKIFCLRQQPQPMNQLLAGIDQLAAAVDSPSEELIDLLVEVVPQYRPNGRPAKVADPAPSALLAAVS